MELLSAASPPPQPAPPIATAVAPAPGDSLGRYLLLNTLYAGDDACVFLAHDPLLNRSVAIKLAVRAAGPDDPGVTERFRHAAQALARALHPSIVTLHEWLDTPHGPALVLEYVVGRSLAQWLAERGPLPAAEAVSLFDPVLVALEQLHRVGVTHGNLTPEHIFVTTDRRIKLLGFGNARIAEDPAAPAKADLYGVGASLYAALLGRMPDAVATPPPIAGVTPALHRVLVRAVATDPRRRFQSARALRDALLHAAAAPARSGWRARLRHRMQSLRWRPMSLELLLILTLGALVLGLGLYPRERPLADAELPKKSARPQPAMPPAKNYPPPAPAPQNPQDRYKDLRQAWGSSDI